MASFADIRAKMNQEYGDSEEEKKRKKEDQEERSKSPSATTNFSTVRTEMDSKYNPTINIDDASIKRFFSTAQNFLNSTEDSYNGMVYSNSDSTYKARKKEADELRAWSWNIRQYLNQSKSTMKAEDYDALVGSLDDFDKAFTSSNTIFYRKNNYFSRWESEDAYIRGATENSEARRKKYEDNKKRIEEIKATLPWNAKTFLPSSVEKWFLSDEADALMDELETLEAENRMYERGEGGYISKLVDDHSKVTTNADFAAVSANRDYTNASKEALWDYDAAAIEGSEALSNKGYFDEDGNIRDYYGNIVRPANAPIVEDKLGMFLSAGEGGVTEAYNRLSATNGNYTDTWANLMQEGDQGSWRYLTEAELDIYYYYLDESQEKAYKYLSDMKTELNRRQTLDESGQWYDAYDEANLLEKIAMNAATVPAKFVSTAAGFVEDTANTIMGNEINPYSAAHGGMHFSQTVRGATAEELDATEFKIPVIDFTLGDIYQTGMSRIDSALATSVFGGGGTVFLGMGAAEEEAYRLYKQGASAEQITLGSFAAGAAEAIWEYLSYGKLKEIKNVDSPGKWVKSVLVQGWNELTEEAATEVTNIVTNALVMGTQSDLAELYKENEGAAFETFVDLLKQTAHAAFGGFLGGIGAGGVQSSKIYANTQAQYAKTGRAIKNADGGVDALMALANEVAGVSTRKTKDSLDKQTAAVGKNATNRKVGRLFNTVSTANDLANASDNQADIAKSLQRKGFSTEDANAIAEAMVANYNGQELTRKQGKLLESASQDLAVQEAAANIAENEQSTMGQRRNKIRDFTNDIALGMVYKSLGIDTKATEKAIEKEFTPAEEYEVSVDGKAIATKTGDAIDVKGVASIRDGEMLLDIGDGKTVNAKDVSYANGNDALIYEAIANLGDRVNAETANKLISQYKGGDAMVFARGITQAYSYGFWGIDKSELTSETSMAAVLTKGQMNAAYQLGAQYRPVKDRADQGKARASMKPGEKGVYYRDKNGNAIDIRSYMEQSGKTLTPVRKTAIEAMEKLAATMGVRFNVFESWKENGVTYYLNENGVKVKGDPNGFYDPKTGEIYIDLNAGNDHSGIMLFTVAHELTHFLRQWSPEHFTKIANIIFKHSGMKGRVSELAAKQQAKAKANGRDISFDEALEEVVADGMETILADGKVMEFMAEVKQQDQTAWEKIKEWFKNFAESLKELIAAYSGRTANSTEGQIVADAKDILSQIEQIFAEGAIAAGENYQSAEVQKNTTDDGGVRLMSREDSARIKDQIVAVSDQLNQMDVVSSVTTDGFAGMKKSDIAKAVEKEYAKFGKRVDRQNFGIILLEYNQINKALEYLYTDGEKAALLTVPRVLKRGIIADMHTEHKERGVDSITFAAPVEINGTRGNVGVVVQRVAGTNRFKTLRILLPNGKAFEFVKNKEADPTTGSSSKHNGSEGIPIESASKNSIRNESWIVKNESAEAMDIEVDAKTESVAPAVLMSERTWKESDYVQERDKAAKEIAQAIGVSVKKAKAYIDSVNSIAKMIADDRVRLDYFSSPGRSSFVGNVEYGGSFDFSTLCKKRRLLTGTFTAIQKALPNTALTADEILDIRNRMKEKGIEVSCGLCYVEGSRANMGQFAKEFLNLYKQYYPDAWQPNMADVNTPDGIEWVRINHPECYEQYEYFWNHYGTLKEGDKNLFASQQKPKLYQLHTEYKGEILEKFNDDDNVEEKNLNGGIRLQSFSDFEIVHLIDTMQIIMDMARVGLAGQAYTKVPDFAWALGDTGLKINLSLIAKGVDENGKLIFDDVEGMPIDTAVELRNRYSKNVGTILVPFNDEQLLAAMADERVDYIIPFHRSQWKKTQYEAMGLPAKVKDYTYMQNEKYIKPQYHEYRGRMVKDKATNYMPNEYWDFSKSGKENAEAYLEMCARNNKRPKFYKLLQNNGDGSYSLKADGSTDGYWKLLIDFKMYDNDGNGSPQIPVKPDFNMDEATRMLNEYSGGHSNFPVAQDVVDSFVQEYKDSHKGAMFSDRGNAPTFYSHMAKVVDAVKQDKLGSASVVSMLRGKGVKAEEIKWSGIETWLEGKKSVTKAELQEFIAGSMLQIEEDILDNKDRPYTEAQQKRLDEYEAKRDEVAKRLADEWKKITGEEFPVRNPGAGLESTVVNKIIDANKEHKDAAFEGRLLKKLRNDLKEVIENNDDFGFDSWKDALRSIHRHRRDFITHYEMATNDKAIIVKYCNALNAYNELPNKISDADTDRLRAIASEVGPWNRKIMEVKHEHNEEEAKYMTNWKQYSLDGGRNYREMLFRIPGSDYSNAAMFAHWKERKGVLAHARVQDMDTFIGKMLFIEEIQSDWHNEGHKKEYRGVPDAPFKDNYHEYVMKRLLREAAEQDYDSIGWTTADIQMERWNPHRKTNDQMGITDAKNPNAVAFEDGYRIEYDQDIPKFLSKYGKKWETKVGKTVLDNGTEVWSMAITDSMKESVLTEGQALYSDRNYMNAVNSGSIALAQEMVLQAAYEAGHRYVGLHGTTSFGFTEFKRKRKDGRKGAHFFTDKYRIAESYSGVKGKTNISTDTENGNYYVALDINNPLVVEGNGSLWNNLPFNIGKKGSGKDGKVITDDVVEYAEKHGYDSVIFKNIVDTGHLTQAEKIEILHTDEGRKRWTSNIYAVFDSKQIKSLDPVTYDNKGKVIPLSERFNRKKSDIRYQDRDTESVSNRSLLANAFEGIITNPVEKQKIQEYKGKVAMLDAEEKKLRELNEQIKELSFAKGPRDTAKIRELQFEAKQTANRIGVYDKQLLRLEASKPLQDALNREKKMAYQRAEQKGKEALAAYREKATKTQRELLDRYRDSRKKAVEGREKTAVRHKIQNVVGELNQLLLTNDKKRHVPDSLKKAVADALSLVNMDTVGAEARAARYATLIAKETDPDKIDAYTVTMENILRQGEKMGQRLKELRDAYEEIQNSDDPDIANAYDPVIAGSIAELSQTIGNTSLRDMTIEQLQDVYDMYKMVLTRVRDANKSLIDSSKETIANRASRVVGEVRRVGGEHKVRAAVLDPMRDFSWNNLKPVYAMERIGSATMTEAFNNVRKGEDTWAQNVTDARAYYIEKSKKYGYDSWDFKKKYRFKSVSEQEFDLTLEQILSLYAYSKRDQAGDHLKLGGFVFDSNIETYKEKGSKLLKYKVNTADAHQISPEIIAEITGTLTKEQTAFVDDMQDYLSTVMGAKGNEVTMKMYGVKLFKEKFYFPLKSARQFMFEQNEVSGEVKIKNSGFTNKTKPKANNPVILNNFMDVWANHVNDMSMYHAFVLPLEDFNRIFNYNSPKKEGKPPVSVKGTIQSAYSPAAVNYVKQLITDLNGGAMADPRETFAKGMTAKFKKAKVFSSMSVVIQQPAAIGRAYALVDPKYFKPTKDGMNHKQLWDELKHYAPVAVIKEMGYFDTNMGRSTMDFIKAKEYSTFGEQAKAVFADSGYRDEILSKLPALADELTWCAIWNAVKRETVAKHHDLSPRSEEFMKIAGERFTEVITKTQVYDSVLARSANMRSKSGLMSMITAFMAEPTTSINMLEDAILKGKRGDKGYAARAFASVAVSAILNNALVALVYGARDDDEDETFAEKYLQAFVSGMLDDLNPITYYPFLKDMWSLLQGYDIERSDMSLVSDLANSMKGLVKAYTSEDGDVAEAWWTITGAVANIGGIPMQNIRREVNGAINFFNTLLQDFDGRATTWMSMGDALEISVRDSLPVVGWFQGDTKTDNLYDAIISGDTAYVSRLKSSYKDKDGNFSQTKYDMALRKALRENDPRINEAAQAQINGDPSERVRIAKLIIADGFAQDDVVAAINAEINAMTSSATSSDTKKAKGYYTATDFATEVANGDWASATAAKTDIIDTAKKNGKSQEEAEKSFVNSATSELKDLFQAGRITESKAVDALVKYCGKNEDDALADVQYWAFKRDYPNTYADDAWFDKYYEEVADSGIEIDVYMDYRNQVKDITGEGKKVRRMAVIDSLPITNAQKDALYFAEGWSKSTLYEAPWH